MSDDVCEKKVVEYLAIGNATPGALRDYLGRQVTDGQFARVMTKLERELRIVRGTWGALAVWKLVKSGSVQ